MRLLHTITSRLLQRASIRGRSGEEEKSQGREDNNRCLKRPSWEPLRHGAAARFLSAEATVSCCSMHDDMEDLPPVFVQKWWRSGPPLLESAVSQKRHAHQSAQTQLIFLPRGRRWSKLVFYFCCHRSQQ